MYDQRVVYLGSKQCSVDRQMVGAHTCLLRWDKGKHSVERRLCLW